MNTQLDRILVIDDEPDMLNVFKTIFSIDTSKELFKRFGGLFGTPDSMEDTDEGIRQEAYVLDYADSGQKGIDIAESRLLENKQISVAFIDIQMHEMNGIDAAVRLYELDPDIEIILITGGTYSPEQITQMTFGRYFYFLNKPFTANEILMFARTLCRHRKNRIEKAQIQEELAHSEAKFRMMAESARDAVIKIDDQGRITFWNHAAEQLTGYRAHEVDQKYIADVIIPENKRDLHKEALEKFQETGQGDCIGKIIEGRAIRKDNTSLPVEISLASAKLDNHWHAVGIVRDISTRKKIEKNLKEGHEEAVNQALEAGRAQVSAMALHNIGNAVTPILIYLEKLSKLDFKKISQYLARCREELNLEQDAAQNDEKDSLRLRQVNTFMKELLAELDTRIILADDLQTRLKTHTDAIVQTLTFQQIYSPRRDEARVTINLNTLLNDLLDIRESSFLKRKITVHRYFGEDLPGIRVEKNRFMQVIANLIQNSINAIDQYETQADPMIRLETRHIENKVRLDISDTGCGIEKSRLKQIFTLQPPGREPTGFGLYYSRHFVETCNGTLEINSSGKGQGACVTLVLPTASENEPKRRNDVAFELV